MAYSFAAAIKSYTRITDILRGRITSESRQVFCAQLLAEWLHGPRLYVGKYQSIGCVAWQNLTLMHQSVLLQSSKRLFCVARCKVQDTQSAYFDSFTEIRLQAACLLCGSLTKGSL